MTSLFTDGSVLVNPNGPGGWAVIVVRDGNAVEQLSGHSPSTTNNIMEMTAVIEAIKFMPVEEHFQVVSDSQYVVNGINVWMGNWAKRGWKPGKSSKAKAIANLSLWHELYTIVQPDRMSFKWIRGHDKNVFNEMADELAGKEARCYA